MAPMTRRRGGVRLLATGAAARSVWEELLGADRDAVISQTPAWLDCVCGLGRHEDASRAYETADGRRLVLPLARGRRLPMAASMPFGWGTGGLVAAGRVEPDDVAGVLADLRAAGHLRLEVRPGPAGTAMWEAAAPATAVRTPHTAQTVDLDGGFDRVWTDRFATRVRRNRRRAERLGLAVESGREARLVQDFDDLYRASVVRWAAQQHEPAALARWRARRRDPAEKFARVVSGLGPLARVWIARRDGAPAAGIVVLTHGEHATYWRGAMDDAAARGTGANELLHVLAIEAACAAGARWYHMGDSSPGSSLAHFKRGFGAEERPHVAYRFERLPLTAADAAARRAVKRLIRFRD
jgi:hypothetical protein